MNEKYENEIAMYPDIIESIKYYMDFYGYDDYEVFKTWKEFAPKLQLIYQKEWNILSDISKPDIMVLYKKTGEEKYKTLIIEVKLNSVKLLDIAQAKMYGDIFQAENVFLVAPTEIRRQIQQYYSVNNNVFKYSNGY